jgi:hypothetical protein
VPPSPSNSTPPPLLLIYLSLMASCNATTTTITLSSSAANLHPPHALLCPLLKSLPPRKKSLFCERLQLCRARPPCESES